MKARTRKQRALPFLIGLLPVIWAGFAIAPYWEGGLFAILEGFSAAMEHPFDIKVCDYTLHAVLACCGIYALVVLYIYSSRLNTRYGEEHGSAKWGDPGAVCKRLRDRNFGENRLFTQHVRIGYNFFWHQRNINSCVIGGSGAKKTRGYVMPNVLQNNCTNIILDPMGEILMGCGRLLEEEGTEVRVLDLIEMEKSHHYNPFIYLRNENDVQTMVTFLFAATTPKEAKSQDPFWEKSAEMLLMALVFFLWTQAPAYEQNFAMVMELLRCAAIEDEDNSSTESITDVLFRELEERDPNHIAVRYYRNYRNGAGKTLKSIQLVLASHLEKFNLTSLAELTSSDDLDLGSLGEKKVALFLRISDTDKSYNFLISLLYNQLFKQLFETADLKYHGKLPVHVHFMMDEAANVKLPDELESNISTCRKRNISVSLILQNLSQLKAQFKDNWESIVGNCDEFLYLGGNEQSTHEFVTKQLGKETIWVRSRGLTRGRNGSSSQNDQTSGRELLTPDEVRMLDNDYCILLIRGFHPVFDLKYELTKHPKIKRTMMGGGEPYFHQRPAELSVGELVPGQQVDAIAAGAQYTALTEAELDRMLEEGSM